MKKEDIEKYIELMYSQKSALNKIEDLNERKMQAVTKAKLNPEDPEIKNIMELKNEKVRVKIINYLNKNNSNLFVKLISDQQLFWNMQQRLMKPLEDDDDTSKLMAISEKSEELVERIEKNYQKLYGQSELVEEAKNVIRMISPEQRLKETKTSA